MDNLVIDYFKTLFSTSSLEADVEFLGLLWGRVFESMNVDLTKEFNRE